MRDGGSRFDFPMSAGVRRALDPTITGIFPVKEGAHTMGMFDRPTPFSERFKEDQPFQLEAAKIGPEIHTDYGTSRPTVLKIEGKWYSVFGQGLNQQVEEMETGDLPARVILTRVDTKSGQRVKKLIPVDAEGKPAQSDNDEIPF